jgi:uncharacterized paraquat-inducible protein A
LGNINKQLITRLKNIVIGIIWLIISIVLFEIFPLHISMATSLAIFVLLLWYMRTSAKKQNMELSKSDINNANNRKNKNNDRINYYCISCGTKHDEECCPRCGSRMKKASFLWYGLTLYAAVYYFF